MSASLQLDGVKELTAALEALPQQMAQQTLAPIVHESAYGLASDLMAAYPKGTGTLANRVEVEAGRDGTGLTAKVRNKAPHAHLYELGTVQRFTNQTGANRGTMPAQPTFVPLAIRWRARMMQKVASALGSMKVPGLSGSMDVRHDGRFL